jgi:hypothetical protein
MNEHSTQVTQRPAKTTSAPADFFLILSLFFSSRLMMLLAFPPENLIFYGDYQHYFSVADLTREGLYPYIHYWYEFPPIFPYLNIGAYLLAGQQLKNYIVILAFFLLLVECGNLYLLYRLAVQLRGQAQGIQIAWIYTSLFIPVFFWLGNFDALTTFFILLGLYGLVRRKGWWLALGIGLGTMVKYVPVLLLATVWRAWGLRAMLRYGAAAIGICLIILGPFLWLSPTFTLASLRAQSGKSSYQTIWALIDGNRTTGNFGPLRDHLEAAKASQPLNNPARLPTWLTLIPFGLLGLFIFSRPRVLADEADAVTFTTLTFIIFILWSQGWSPQWQTFLIPLLLLTLPVRRAVLFIIVLGFINFLEWPVILSRGLTDLLPITIIIRTLILILLAVELYQLFSGATSSKKVYRGEVPN